MSNHYKYHFIKILIFCSLTCCVVAQESHRQIRLETDQLLEYFRSRKNKSVQISPSIGGVHDGKCGFWIGAQVLSQWNRFSDAQQKEMSILMQPGPMQCNIIAGQFRIYYDTSGLNTPCLLDNFNNRIPGTSKAFIDSVASIFNHVWSVEVDQMGYTAPPFEDGQSYYNIYVEELGSSIYGQTTAVGTPINGSSIPPRYSTFIEIDNDFKDVKSKGISGLEVTAAHEFHHAIQYGYGFWENDTYAYEITSTWLEDELYTDVNDYYNYLSWYFDSTPGFWQGLPFYDVNHYGGYERCIWNHYLAKRFSPTIIREIWEEMRTQSFLPSAEIVLSNWGSSLSSAFAEFTYWNYFTKNRANPEKYYPEGENYPIFQPLQQISFSTGTLTVSGNVYPLSSSIYQFNTAQDALNIIVANADVEAAKRGELTPLRRVDITLSTEPLAQPVVNLANGLMAQVRVSDNLSLWRYFFSQEVERADASPNPLRLDAAQRLMLPVNEDGAQTAEVYFYTPSLSLACSGSFNIIYEYGSRIIVIPTSEIKSKLSSGIYFVFAKTVNRDYKWKVAVIR
jgi:hypothetical protein